MRELLLLRHAKSSWEPAAAARDFDRPLNARGRAAAPVIGGYLAEHDLAPDIVYCSTAARTRETLALIRPALPPATPALFKDSLYLASPERMLEEIVSAAPEDRRLLLIAHNPGLEELAFALADPATSDPDALARLRRKYPTAGLAQFAFEATDWRSVSPHAGRLLAFITPKDLSADL